MRDNGDDLDADELPHVFECFYRADTGRERGHGGLGIGLTIARSLVHAQHGTAHCPPPVKAQDAEQRSL